MAFRTALGWRAHSGWAVLVVVREPAVEPHVLDRRRVELVEGPVPRQPYHAVAEGGAPRDVIFRAEERAMESAIDATNAVRDDFGVEAVGVVGRRRNVPDDLDKILASHMLLHAAEGELYERVLLEAAASAGLPVTLVDPSSLVVPLPLENAGKTLGPPWQKDHKLAAAAALLAL